MVGGTRATLALILCFCILLIMVSCENWPYKPHQFLAPKLPPPPNAFISRDSLYAFVGPGASDIKLAYTLIPTSLGKTIYFVDFNDSIVSPKELKKPIDKQDWDANCPIISPDGKLVTYYLISGTQAAVYCQKLDTNAAPADAIGDPGSEPHFYKDGSNLFVTYTDATGGILSGTNTTITGYHTYKQQIDPATGQKTGTRDSIAGFPFYGGMSHDGKYICTGYASAYIFNISTQHFFAINPNQQTCNPSMTPDSILTGRMMFLNIGGHEKLNNMPSADTGNVGEHQFVFIADTNNNYISGFDLENSLPAYSSGEWQCPKWTNVPGFFCALAWNGTDNNKHTGNLYNCFLVSVSSPNTPLQLNKPALLQFDGASKPYVFIGGN
jgi:hypothetical protein